MTDEADEGMVARPPTEAEKEQIRHAVAQVVAGTVLRVQEQPYELIIRNPHKPANGQIYVDFEEGHVARRHVAWEYLGVLAGVEHTELTATVTRQVIASLLGGL